MPSSLLKGENKTRSSWKNAYIPYNANLYGEASKNYKLAILKFNDEFQCIISRDTNLHCFNLHVIISKFRTFPKFKIVKI